MSLLFLFFVAALIIAWGVRAWSAGFGRRMDSINERMSLAARICEAAARNAFDVELDHSVASIAVLDRIIDHDFTHSPEMNDDAEYVLGAYLGNVLCNELGARWTVRDTLVKETNDRTYDQS